MTVICAVEQEINPRYQALDARHITKPPVENNKTRSERFQYGGNSEKVNRSKILS